MKTTIALVLVGLVVATYAHGEGHEHGGHEGHHHGKKGKAGLKHFRVGDLDEKFRSYQLPEGAVCSEEVQTCLKNVHMHARKCFMIKTGALAQKVRQCRRTNQEVKDADKSWQEASFKWHKGLQQCVKAEPVPDTSDDPLFETDEFFFRRKREVEEAAEGEEEPCDGGEGEYESFQQCWGAMKKHHESCKAKVIPDCPILARCDGFGEVPEDENQAAWYNYMKVIRQDKEEKMRNYRTALFQCMDIEGMSQH